MKATANNRHAFFERWAPVLERALNATTKDPDHRFMWNHFIYNNFTSKHVSKGWRLPIIQGYVGHFFIQLQSDCLLYFLISRRSHLQSGTRYISVGLDDEGNVANFNETE